VSQSASALQRVAVSLSRGERDALRELATRRSEPEATTAARLVRAGLADAGARLDPPPKRRRGPVRNEPPGPAQAEAAQPVPWLPTTVCAAAVSTRTGRWLEERSRRRR